MNLFASAKKCLAVCGMIAVTWGVAVYAQTEKSADQGKATAAKPKFQTMYSLEKERYSTYHRRTVWFNKGVRGGTRAHIKLNVIAPKIDNRMVSEQIAKIHQSLRELNVEAEVVWQYSEDEKHENKHIRVSADEHVRPLIDAHADHSGQKLNVFVVELDVDVDGDGVKEPAVGVRFPSSKNASTMIEAVLIDDEAFETHKNAFAHSIGHFFGLVTVHRDDVTHDFRQDGSRIGCKACLKSVGASAAP
jgi:hypothetical protein